MSQNYEEIELTDDEYEQQLNDAYGPVDICGMTFDAGRALRELDPIAFRCGLADEPQRWRCLGCGKIYEEEDEAAECCYEEEDEAAECCPVEGEEISDTEDENKENES